MMTLPQIDVGWVAGGVECLSCGYHWIGVWQIGTDTLECPRCSETDTARE